MRKRVLIVGAGIAGHTLACALAQRGISFDIVELKKNWEILGAGMYVQNNALRGFQDIGVAEAVIEAGWYSEHCPAVFAEADGTEIARTKVPPHPTSTLPGYVPCSRPALHQILSAALSEAGGSIRMGTTVAQFEQSEESVEVTFDDGSTGSYDLLVGADGINSGIRAAIFPDVKPQYSGFSNWRAILPSGGRRPHVLWQIGAETSFGIIPISDTKVYLAGVTKEPGNPWFEQAQLLDLMRERFADFGGEAAAFLSQVKSADDVVYTPVNEVIMARPWSKGRVVLVGDAVHASTPFWAQGAAMAVEDVILLARMLETDRSIPQLLHDWEDRRYDRCVFVQQGSKNTGERGHAAGKEALRLARDHIRDHAQRDLNARLERLNQPF